MLKAQFLKYTLNFINPSGTSRGVLKEKPSWFLKIHDTSDPKKFGLGECGPILGLSRDNIEDYEVKLHELCEKINEFESINLNYHPSIKFGLEMALLDLKKNGKRILFKNDFTNNAKEIKINGLIWMGEMKFMYNQIKDKLNKGFDCIKIKIGAINFEDELSFIKKIRTEFGKNEIEIRVDANGAFTPKKAPTVLNKLAHLDIHSIEQPISAGQPIEMKKLCENTPIPIALDEELINLFNEEEKNELLQYISPQYIILKPSLLGGFKETNEWIKVASENNISWWITSALESNIGLNAIAQYCGNFNNQLPQGLGTGGLYSNNFISPLTLNGQYLTHKNDINWETKSLIFDAD